jgi:hypothetical protein
VQELLDHTIEVKLVKIPLADLNLENNPDLSGSILGSLIPLIQK